MKKISLIIIAFIIGLFVLTSFVQSSSQQDNRPKAVYRVGGSKVMVWVNKKSDGTTWKNFEVEKVYKKGGKWATSNSFDERELLQLRAAIDKAISEESVITK